MFQKQKSPSPFSNFFDCVYVINLPSRKDRLDALKIEIKKIGLCEPHIEVRVPYAPIVDDPGGFPSTGVYGNFLSHLGIIRDVRERGLTRALVLEDDAIFRSELRSWSRQEELLEALARGDWRVGSDGSSEGAADWGMWFLGHRLRKELKGAKRPLAATTLPFNWAHCYAVNKPVLDDLIDYLDLTMQRPAGHPDGGKMYIDGAFAHFRKKYTNYPCLVSNPVHSIQKGSDSNLAKAKKYYLIRSGGATLKAMRGVRDEIWRRTGIDFRR